MAHAGLEASLLHAPAQVGVRAVARVLAARVAEALVALQQGGDPEALHDFRVAVRRLRSWLRSHRAALGRRNVKRPLRALRAVAHATNAPRDAQVFTAWLDETMDGLTARQKAGAAWLRQQFAAAPTQPLPDREAAAADEALAELERMLPIYKATLHLDGEVLEPTFARGLSVALRRASARLQRRLKELGEPQEAGPLHQARIAGKRLRYLLEPLAPHLAGAPAAIAELKQMQDTFGDLHDAHVWLAHVRETAEAHLAEESRRLWESGDEESSSPPSAGPDIRPGLVAITRVLRERIREGHQAARAAWTGAAAEPFFDRITAVAAACEFAPPADTEIERKYLLVAVPEHWPEGETVFIDQGYLPGDRLVERVRRTRSRAGERFHRTVKSGVGLSRLEIEEECTRELFEALWPLTDGRRVTKRRHRVRDGALTWEIDEFTDRDLVLAEVEVPSADYPVTVPEWLEPVVVREVTGDPAFANSTLAR
ncbi:MAG: CHAD domain-containing protein [Gemmatimonadetes bacterium]|nr:CHAD domain-containing protein [Gemmatimonadota bacterium]